MLTRCGIKDTTAQMIEAIWPLSVVSCSRDTVLGGKTVLGLRTFIQEVLKRSKTSYSTLQVALYYLVLIKAFVPKCDFTMEQFDDSNASRAMQCGRRMFLAALILASKYLQDRNYSARAWSKISGLKVCEINTNEMAFLLAVNWKLHIPESLFQRWTDVVLKYSSAQSDQATADLLRSWKAVVLQLTPELDNLDALDVLNEPASPSCPTDWSTVNLKEDWGMSCKSGYDLALRSTLPQPTSAPRLCSPPRFSSPFSSSNEQTPTNSFAIPQVLEPTPRESSSITGKLPPMLTLGPLPTPHMTPHAVNNFCTPAVSASGSCSRRSSMGYAMKQVHNTNLNQSAFDMWKQNPYPAFPTSARRSSLARSVSSMSSPESMISDTSSRSSRSSSISSIASSTCALPQPRLAVQATRRCAKMQLSGIKEDSRPTCFPLTNSDGSWAAYTASPDACGGNSSLDFHKLSVAQSQSQQCLAMPTPHDLSDQEAAEGLRELALNLPRNPPQSLLQPGSQSSLTRKRERTESADLTPIQQNVRALLNQRCLNDVTNNSNTRIEDDGMGVLPDTNIADSFLSTENNSRLSELKSLLKENSNGRKRVCYDARIAAPAMPFMAHGPGMWSDIL